MESESSDGAVTDRLICWNEGDSESQGSLMRAVYRQLASPYLRREAVGHTFQTSLEQGESLGA